MTDDIQPPSTKDPLDEAGGRALVEAWQASGLSGAAFCRQRNLRPQRLHYWRERLGYPMKVVEDGRRPSLSRPPSAEGFVEVVVGPPASPPITHVDIVVGDALVRVRPGFDAHFLREVVRAMVAAPSPC